MGENLNFIANNPYLRSAQSSNYADALGLYRPDNFQIANSLANPAFSTMPKPYANSTDSTLNLMKMLYQYRLYETLSSRYEDEEGSYSRKRHSKIEDIVENSDSSDNNKTVSNNKKTSSSQVSSGNKTETDVLLEQLEEMDYVELVAEGSASWGAYKLAKDGRTKPVILNNNQISKTIGKISDISLHDNFKSALITREEALNKVVKAEEALKKAKGSERNVANKALETAKREFNDINKDFQETLKTSQKTALEELSKHGKGIDALKTKLKGQSGKDALKIIRVEKEIARKAGNGRMLGLLNKLETGAVELTEANISKALKTASQETLKSKSAVKAASKSVGKLSKTGKFLGKGGKLLGKAAIVASVALEGYDVYKAVKKDGGHFGKNAKKQALKSTMGLGASLASGAIVGTCIGGPIGTAVGAVAGIGMYFVGSWGGGKIADEVVN